MGHFVVLDLEAVTPITAAPRLIMLIVAVDVVRRGVEVIHPLLPLDAHLPTAEEAGTQVSILLELGRAPIPGDGSTPDLDFAIHHCGAGIRLGRCWRSNDQDRRSKR